MAKVIIDTPNGEINYDVTMMQISDFTIDSIFENKLYLTIPFYIFKSFTLASEHGRPLISGIVTGTVLRYKMEEI